MAKISIFTCAILFYLNTFMRTSGVNALDGLHFYKTKPQTHISQIISINYIDGHSHYLTKRRAIDVPEKNDTSIKSEDTNLHSSYTSLNLTKITQTEKTPDNYPSNAPRLNLKVTKLPPISNVTPKEAFGENIRLLGVNGTGQRKYYPTTTENATVITTPLQDISTNITDQPNFDDIINNISISKFTDNDLNNTLTKHNITNETVTENYFYYNSSIQTNPEVAKYFWVNLSTFDNATTHKLLSSAHRRAATVTLSFEFPFYGHLIKNVTIATGGFLYTGDYVHAWLAATQYIAPLMANFDTSLSNYSFVRYKDNGTAFTVLWEKVALRDRAQEGEFTFQTTLHKNGDIIFVYDNVPTIIENIKDDQHPVKIGLSDAYIIDSTLFFLRRKTIYEYHRVNFQKDDIKNGTVIILKALPTCLDATDCNTCLTKELSSFQCVWCPSLKRCSSGVDRHRQEWIMKGCDQIKIKNSTSCSRSNSYDIDAGNSAYVHDTNGINIYRNTSASSTPFSEQSVLMASTQADRIGVSGVLTIIILLFMIVAIPLWVFYAYRNPHTTSGQILIRYRPTQWRWKRGEARYTAATIHM